MFTVNGKQSPKLSCSVGDYQQASTMNVAIANGLTRNDEASGLKSQDKSRKRRKTNSQPKCCLPPIHVPGRGCSLQLAAEQHGPGSKVGLGPVFTRVASFVGELDLRAWTWVGLGGGWGGKGGISLQSSILPTAARRECSWLPTWVLIG